MATTLTDAAKHYAQKAPISLACSAAQSFVKMLGGSPEQEDEAALRLARAVVMKDKGRAAEYLEHFISGSGKAKYFDLSILLAEEKDIMDRVVYEVTRKLVGVKVGTEKKDVSYDPVITLFQKNFRNQDWWYALGSFGIEWEEIRSSQNEDRAFVKLYGENLYTWHPESNRITQCLHEAGTRLEKNYGAKSFMIKAKPTVLIISLKNRKLIQMTTLHNYNPNNMTSLVSQVKNGVSNR